MSKPSETAMPFPGTVSSQTGDDESETGGSGPSVFWQSMAMHMGVTSPMLFDAINQVRAITGYTQVTQSNRWMEEVVSYEEERPLMRYLSSITSLLLFIYTGLLLFKYTWSPSIGGEFWLYTPIQTIPLAAFVIVIGVLLIGFFEYLNGDVTVNQTSRRREETYYPPKAYWDDVTDEDIPPTTND